MSALTPLLDVIDRLLAPDGCEWDRAQTPTTLRSALLEEAAEAVDAISAGPVTHAQEELGDLLFVTLLTISHYERLGQFTLADTVQGTSDKLIGRHPHVFGGADERPDWDEMKARERSERPDSLMDDLPRSLSGLMRGQEASRRAAKVGFDWPDISGVVDKLDEELAELKAALATGAPDHIEEEMGDLLFTLANLARKTNLSAEVAAQVATRKFEDRFRHVEALCLADGRTVSTTPLDQLDRYWNDAKQKGS